MKKTYTDKQGQYMAFIYYYSKIHGCAPSEAEMQQYFRVSPSSVHQMILTLEAHGLIERTPDGGREVRYRLRPRALSPASSWLAKTEHAWDARLLRLKGAVEQAGRSTGGS